MITLNSTDWGIIIGFFAVSIAIGLYSARKSGKSSAEFFLSGRNMPWWLLGISMVATTFSADTPNLVTDIVRKNGVSGNWVWWAFLLTGMLTVFVYAKLWRRTGFLTDLEFYEARYSGAGARFLRVFRAFYLGVIFNVLVMATVCLAGIKIGSVLLGLTPVQTILVASLVTVVYSAIGGLRGIILTDLFQFTLAMVGTVWAAVYIVNLPAVGGLEALLAHENVAGKLSLIPDWNDKDLFYALFLIPLTVQWWATYYPGAEPGGGGYIAQRMLAAKSENHAMSATMLFNVAHYALRPWPWIIIALASLVVFPDFQSIVSRFPHIEAEIINDDLAYSAMLTFLPNGLLGIVTASLIAAFMSTISTHLNWGASYITNDIYKRVLAPSATEQEMVRFGRLSTIGLMILSGILALYLQNALKAFNIIRLIGAGTGLIFILRWFWWRINAYSEISAMVASFLVAIYFANFYTGDLATYQKLLVNVVATTLVWLAFTFFAPGTEKQQLETFYLRIKPFRWGWQPVADRVTSQGDYTTESSLIKELLAMALGVAVVYGALFAFGFLIYGKLNPALIAFGIVVVAGLSLKQLWPAVSGAEKL